MFELDWQRNVVFIEAQEHRQTDRHTERTIYIILDTIMIRPSSPTSSRHKHTPCVNDFTQHKKRSGLGHRGHWGTAFFSCLFFYTSLPLTGKVGPPYVDKATAAARAAMIPSPASVCWGFSCFRNPPNSDMGLLGSLTCVRDHSCACVYTHGGWAYQQRVSVTFLTLKNSPNFCSLRGPLPCPLVTASVG